MSVDAYSQERIEQEHTFSFEGEVLCQMSTFMVSPKEQEVIKQVAERGGEVLLGARTMMSVVDELVEENGH